MLNSAKKFAMKNKEKIAAGVDKATDVIDKKTKGKHHDKLEKADAAAAKFGGKPKQPDAADTVAPAPAAATPADDATKPAPEADVT
jgi:antitoxin protein of toxin-antitoxin system